MFLQIFNETQTAFRICITAISKRMYKNVGNGFGFTAVNNCFQMIDMGVHAAITHQAEQVQFFILAFGFAQSLQ